MWFELAFVSGDRLVATMYFHCSLFGELCERPSVLLGSVDMARKKGAGKKSDKKAILFSSVETYHSLHKE